MVIGLEVQRDGSVCVAMEAYDSMNLLPGCPKVLKIDGVS